MKREFYPQRKVKSYKYILFLLFSIIGATAFVYGVRLASIGYIFGSFCTFTILNKLRNSLYEHSDIEKLVITDDGITLRLNDNSGMFFKWGDINKVKYISHTEGIVVKLQTILEYEEFYLLRRYKNLNGINYERGYLQIPLNIFKLNNELIEDMIYFARKNNVITEPIKNREEQVKNEKRI